jgi:predicted ArsR family transcriptional regulator
MPYPRDPGRKALGTSRDAAEAITSHAKTMRDRVLAFLTQHHPRSFAADEIAAGLGESILTVRPRVSELRRSGLIEPTAERRRNKSGLLAKCWRAVVTGGQA